MASPLEGEGGYRGYAPGEVERFAIARARITGPHIRAEVSLQLEGKVRMTLREYEAIGAEFVRLRGEIDYLQEKVTAVRTAVS